MAFGRRWMVLALLLAACGDSDAPAPEAPPSPPSAAALYKQRCASCHDGAKAAAAYGDRFRLMRPEAIMTAMDGIMARQAAGLSLAQRASLAEFLAGKELGLPASEPPPLACEAWQNRIDVDRPPLGTGVGLDFSNTRLTGAVARLGAAELPRLEVKWAFAFPGATRVLAQPAIAGGAVFTGSEDGTLFALDEAGGCVRWTFRADAEIRAAAVVSPWQPGDPTAQPALYFGDAAGNAYRLDAATGVLVWKVSADDHASAAITGTPVLHDGRLYVPVASTEQVAAADPDYECCTFRGSVVALDAATGNRIWTSWPITSEPRLTGDTNAAGTPLWQPAGAAIRGSPALDPARRRLYVATGAGYTSPAAESTDSVIALDLDSGKQLWRHQAVPGDAWTMSCLSKDKTNCPAPSGTGADFAAPPMLVALPGGRDLVLAAQISGHILALDALTGAAVWRRNVGGVRGGMAADGTMLYAPTRTGLLALDAVTGGQHWFAPTPDACQPEHKPGCGGALIAAVTALPGAVLAGGQDGQLRAYDAASGEIIWSFDTTAEQPTPNGGSVRGGSMHGGGPTAAYGRLFVTSGSLLGGHMDGNALIVFEPARDYQPRRAPTGE
ncbi:PQQ-binding-like beta-propeller repeat protein [Emcibacter sp. SYSU 3D8]|uniref:outer membrane protein assembly factor BamB family protein n=1 Tax=Emcibacter sp. SYSU 3D8 TaxID=3133969 RepID=UPI0031FE5C14